MTAAVHSGNRPLCQGTAGTSTSSTLSSATALSGPINRSPRGCVTAGVLVSRPCLRFLQWICAKKFRQQHVHSHYSAICRRTGKQFESLFFNKIELSASVVVKGRFLAVLRTDFHRHCKEITMMEGDLTPSRVILFPPSTSNEFYHIPGFIILESVNAYDVDIPDDEVGPTAIDHIDFSERYFQLTCRCGETPVFSMEGEVVGIVICDFRPTDGVEHAIKLGLCAKDVWDSVHALVPELRESKNSPDVGSSSSEKKRFSRKKSRERKSTGRRRKRGRKQ